jgi:hypothetical protein
MTIKVPSLDTDPDYRAAKLLGDKLKANRDAAMVEAQRLKALEGFKYDDPANHARIARIAAGETIEDEDEADNKVLSKKASNKFSDLSDACDIHGRRMRDIHYSASKTICAKLKSEHDALMKRFFAGLLEVHNASVEYYQLKTDLMAEDIKFIGICGVSPHTIFGSPTDKQSPLGYLFREAKALNYLSKVPAEFA